MRVSNVEQVGAIQRIGLDRVHLRMMGHELSFNGIVAAAVSATCLYGNSIGVWLVECDIGGCSTITARAVIRAVSLGIGSFDVELTFTELVPYVEDAELTEGVHSLLVQFPGISHLVHESSDGQLPPEEVTWKILARLRENATKAAGVIYFQQKPEGIHIWPYVWVSGVESVVAETSCGSGAAAVAVSLWHREIIPDGTLVNINQPSGSGARVSRGRSHNGEGRQGELKYQITVDGSLVTSLRSGPLGLESL